MDNGCSKKRKENLTLAQRIEILDFTRAHPIFSQLDIARHYSQHGVPLSQGTVSRLIRDEAKLRDKAKDPARMNDKRERLVEFPDVERALAAWVQQAESQLVPVTGAVLKMKAQDFARLSGVPADEFLSCSNGWLDSFKGRHKLKQYRWHGEAGSIALETVADARTQLKQLTDQYVLRDIWNMDETGLFGRMPPDRTLATKQLAGLKGDKWRLSYAFTTNADGSDRFNPLVIGRYQRPRCFRGHSGQDLGYNYFWNRKSWMKSDIFEAYLTEFDEYQKELDRHALLLVDGFSAHKINASKFTNVRVEIFPANMTSHIQPLDQGIIRCFKAHYRSRFILRAVEREMAGIEIQHMYDINQLEVMELAEEAWWKVSDETIRNCWRHSGI
ncbi:DDE-domain-containing protein, partial [Calocera viscosa TUFC12733]